MKLTQVLLLAGVLLGAGVVKAPAQDSTGTRRIFGTIDSLSGSHLVIRTRTGSRMDVDALDALTHARSAPLAIGRNVEVLGDVDSAGVLHAKNINRAKAPTLWPPDR